MTHDPIVEEVRAIRERLAAKFDFDLGRIIADARSRQASSGARVVSFQTRRSSAEQGPEPDREQAGELSQS